MDRRGRRFWLKVFIGLVFTILVIDVLALTYAVLPLAASQQKRAEPAAISARLTQNPAELALILPTHDPRKPWVTRTPRPTATPWLVLAATLAPQRPATPGPAENAAQVAADPARVGTAPESGDVMAPGAPSPLGGEPAGPTPSPSADVGAAAMLPTSALVPPPSTRSPTPSQGTDQPPPPITPGDAAQFGAYVLDHYGVIAGQPMEIAVVSVDTTEAGQPEVVVEVVGSDASNVFAAQTAAAALDYGRRLLDDTKLYSGGQSCAVKVVSSYDTSYPDPCRNNPSWCTVGERDQSNSKWSIAWTYVLGTSTDAADSVETWNTGQ